MTPPCCAHDVNIIKRACSGDTDLPPSALRLEFVFSLRPPSMTAARASPARTGLGALSTKDSLTPLGVKATIITVHIITHWSIIMQHSIAVKLMLRAADAAGKRPQSRYHAQGL